MIIFSPFVEQFADRRYDGGCAGSEHLFQLAVFISLFQLVDGDLSLRNLDAFLLAEGDDGVSGDARLDGAVELAGYHLVADDEEGVGRADLFDIFLFNAVQPQNLLITLFVGDLLRLQAGAVVAAALSFTGAAL